MITVIHGEDVVKSRNELIRLKDSYKDKDVRVIEGKALQDGDLVQALSSSSLFDSEVVVIIEQLFASLGKKIKQAESFIRILLDHNDYQIVIWEGKEIGKSILKQFGNNITIKYYPIPTLVFHFLDTIKPHAQIDLLKQYTLLINSEAPELIHVLFIRRIKQLLLIKERGNLEGIAPWQLNRLTNQMRLFTMDQLLDIYLQLLTIELANKTGNSYLSLVEATERVISRLSYEY